MGEITVSIICNTYNHENYIRRALDGFVMQKTNFAFEVLIHDDASTDKTAEIIKEYEAKYPEIIKPIYQTENQYSKGVKISVTYHIPRIKGRYVAFCEGDDYWIDPLKLQKQYDAMELHPEVDMCAHSAVCVNAVSEKQVSVISPKSQSGILTTEEVIMGEGGFIATNSLFYRTSLYDNQPLFRNVLSLDYTLQILGSLRGGILYLNEYMSAYRVLAPQSWTVRMRYDTEKRKIFCEKKRQMLLQLDLDTDGKYSDTIACRMHENDFQELLDLNCCKALLKPEYRDVYRRRPVRERILIRIKAYLPFLVTLKRRLKGKKHRRG